MSMVEQLQELQRLLDAGAITPAEFEVARQRLLGASPSTTPVGVGSPRQPFAGGEVGRALPWGGALALVGAALGAIGFFFGPWDFISYLWSCCPRQIADGFLVLAGTAIPMVALVGLGVVMLTGTRRVEVRGALAATGMFMALGALLWVVVFDASGILATVVGGLVAFAGSFAWRTG